MVNKYAIPLHFKSSARTVSILFLLFFIFQQCNVVPEDFEYQFDLEWGSNGSGDNELNGPSGMAVDSSGNIYVADNLNHCVKKFDAFGNFLTKFGSDPAGVLGGTGDGEFSFPSNMALDTSGNIYIVDSVNYRIQKFDSDGDFITAWGSEADFGFGFIREPAGVAVDSSDNVYVTDIWQSLILQFDSSGNFITAWASGTGDSFRPTGIAVDSSEGIYITDYLNSKVMKFDFLGEVITEWGTDGTETGELMYPSDIAVDSSGDVYVADTLNNRIQKFNSEGAYITACGTEGTGEGEFDRPFGVAVDSSGNVFASDAFNHRIQKFTYAPVAP